MIELPPFKEFLETIDGDAFTYDVKMHSTERMRREYNPFTEEQFRLIIDTSVVLTQTIIAHYHQWMCTQLRRSSLEKESR